MSPNRPFLPALATVVAAGALTLAVGVSSARAATWPAVTMPQLCRMSSAVVRVRIVASQAAVAEQGRIFTTHDVQVLDQAYPDDAPPQSMQIQQPGGRVGDDVQGVGGMTLFEVGDELVLFVGGTPPGRTMPLAGPRGSLRVVNGKLPDLPAVWPEAATDDVDAFLAHVRRVFASLPNPN